MHRGAEKLFEARDYRQIIMLANRHDWLSAFANELGVVLAVERMLGMEVPERAVWVRTLLAELNRVLNHLMFLGSYPLELGAITPVFYAFREREELQAVHGGGLPAAGCTTCSTGSAASRRTCPPAGWAGCGPPSPTSARGCRTSRTWCAATRSSGPAPRGVGVLSAEHVRAYGVSGPIARASGVDFDLRRDEPYLAYGELRDVLTRRHPRARATAWPGSSACSSRSTSRSTWPTPASTSSPTLPAGPINVRLPKVVKAPEGETYAWTENPLGINGYYLVSRGEKTPWRLKLRSASFNNIQVLAELLPGHPGRRHGRDPRLDVLRRRRHRQVAPGYFFFAAFLAGFGSAGCGATLRSPLVAIRCSHSSASTA